MSEKLFLIDGSALYYRSYFAFSANPLINSKGENTSATFGFLSSLIKLIEEEKPSYLAVIFDTREPTFRHNIYPEYKATREKMPEEMAVQFPRLVDTLRRLNFKILEKDGYEADDIIGTLAARFASFDLNVFIVSGDKDMAQLVNDHVLLYNLGKANKPPEIVDKKGVKAKLGVEPHQVIEWLALMGDSSDNIPGIPKIGEVTASKFLNNFGSIQQLYEKISELNDGIIKDNLLKCRQQAELSKQLATIDTNVPLELTLNDLQFRIWDLEPLEIVLNELEFRRLYSRMKSLAQSAGTIDQFSKHKDEDHQYMVVENWEQFEAFWKELKEQKLFCFDLETDSLTIQDAQIAGIAFSWYEHSGYYLPLKHPDVALDGKKVLDRLKTVFRDPSFKKIGQNIKFDAAILTNHGLEVKGIYFDTMIASYLINPSGQHNLDKLSEYYLNYEMIHIKELIGSGKKQKLMTELPAREVGRYAVEDADITLRLYHTFKPKIKDLGMEDLFYTLEMPLVQVLMAMENHGVRLDVGLLQNLSSEISGEIEKLRNVIYEAAQEEFNLNSPPQLASVLFDKLEIHKSLNLKKPPKTKTGQYTTSEGILERYIHHPIVADIMNFRKLSKLQNTYLDALPKMVSEKTGRVHTSFNQTVTATGRLSSSNPNLQNIPIRTELGREIRKAFIPSRPDYRIVSADYSQIELRVMAHLSGDETMIEAFNKFMDIHTSTAALIFDIPVEEVTPDHRRKAKEINFGIIYGMSAYGLAARLNISNADAEEFIADYMATYPKVDAYMTKCKEIAREKGYVETMMHRRRYLPEIKSDNRQIREFAERTAINTPIQGSAADLIKKAMIEIHHYIQEKQLPAAMLLQVHDELVFEVQEKSRDHFKKDIVRMMENCVKLRVPIVVECGDGNNWLEAH